MKYLKVVLCLITIVVLSGCSQSSNMVELNQTYYYVPTDTLSSYESGKIKFYDSTYVIRWLYHSDRSDKLASITSFGSFELLDSTIVFTQDRCTPDSMFFFQAPSELKEASDSIFLQARNVIHTEFKCTAEETPTFGILYYRRAHDNVWRLATERENVQFSIDKTNLSDSIQLRFEVFDPLYAFEEGLGRYEFSGWIPVADLDHTLLFEYNPNHCKPDLIISGKIKNDEAISLQVNLLGQFDGRYRRRVYR